MQTRQIGCIARLTMAVLVVGGIVWLAGTLRQPYRTLHPVPRSSQAAQSAGQKLLQIVATGVEATATRRPVAFSQTFNDEELTSFIADRIPPGGLVDGLVVRAGTGNIDEGTAVVHLGMDVPAYFRATLMADNGRPMFHVLDSRAGSLGMPGVFDGVLNTAIQVPLIDQVLKVRDLSLTTAPGLTTISGTSMP
jgi:hypothetical protein